MSGGHWEYLQYRFTDVIEDIKKLIEQNGQPKTDEELREFSWHNEEWYKKYPEDKFHYKYSEEHIKEFKKAILLIGQAQIYMQRLDWMLSGDDSEESFLKRLDEDLKKLDDELI